MIYDTTSTRFSGLRQDFIYKVMPLITCFEIL
jgi:hypothetical protein